MRKLIIIRFQLQVALEIIGFGIELAFFLCWPYNKYTNILKKPD